MDTEERRIIEEALFKYAGLGVSEEELDELDSYSFEEAIIMLGSMIKENA